MMSITISRREKLAYLAGLLDSDGCIGFTDKAHKRTHLRVVFAEGEETSINWLIENFGGTRTHYNQNKTTFPSYKQLIVWNLRGEKAKQLLKEVTEFLILKRGKGIQS